MTRAVAPAPEWLWQAASDVRVGRITPNALRLADAIEDYRSNAHLGQTIEVALGLEVPSDLRPWHAASLRERRDALLAELAADLKGSTRSLARELLAESRRYAGRVLKRQAAGHVPPRTRRERAWLELFQIADSGGPKWPLSDRQIRTWLGNRSSERGAETAHLEAVA